MSVYFCGGSCIEDVTYTSDTGKTYDFNTADKLNTLLLNCLLKEGEGYDVDFDHQFIETEKYDAKLTYKKFLGYHPGVAVIGDILLSVYTNTPVQVTDVWTTYACILHRDYLWMLI